MKTILREGGLAEKRDLKGSEGLSREVMGGPRGRATLEQQPQRTLGPGNTESTAERSISGEGGLRARAGPGCGGTEGGGHHLLGDRELWAGFETEMVSSGLF